MTKQEFNEYFATKEQCDNYLFTIKWSNGFVCPYCGNGEYWETKEQTQSTEYIRYKCRKCKRKTTLYAGTLFQGIHLPITNWFQGLWYLANISGSKLKKVSVKEFQNQLGAESYCVAYNELQKTKRLLYWANPQQLKGKVAVFTDLGGKISKTLSIAVGIELENKDSGCIKCALIKKHSPEDLLNFIEKHIEKDSEICSVGYIKGFEKLMKMGYKHSTQIPMWANRKAQKIANNIVNRFSGRISYETATRIIHTYCDNENCFKRPIKFEDIIKCAVNVSQEK